MDLVDLVDVVDDIVAAPSLSEPGSLTVASSSPFSSWVSFDVVALSPAHLTAPFALRYQYKARSQASSQAAITGAKVLLASRNDATVAFD